MEEKQGLIEKNKVSEGGFSAGLSADKLKIDPSARAKVQLTWKNIVITAPAKTGRCGKKLPEEKPKTIL